jgi:dTDP-4-dehydrorhamnose reductase
MRIVVTGGAGMLGTDLLIRLACGHEAKGIDLADVDILDEHGTRDVIVGIRPDWVIHCAAFTNVDGCEKEPEKAFSVNADGARNVAKACWSAGARLLYVSTDYVYNGSKKEPYVETDTPAPLNAYGKSKLKGEHEIMGVLPDALIVRTSWLFGENGPNFVKAILGQVGKKKELEVVADQVGNPTYTPDLADALARLVECGAKGLYHVSNSGSCSWFEYARKVLELAGASEMEVKPITTSELGRPALRPAYSVLSNEKYSLLTGHALRGWDEALSEYLKDKKA